MTQSSRVHFSRDDIGGELLPILTRGLYRDTLDSLREYIQNAIDADAAHVRILVDPDVVSILDDGVGMNLVEARKAIRLGISEKNPATNVGFRGIGIYSGFNLCDTLEIFTKSEDEDLTYRLFFDFRRIRRELLEEQERRNSGYPPELSLERLLEDSVFMEPTDEGGVEHRGTRVMMSGLLPDAYRRINNWDEVVDYLQNVVPLPFSPEFRYGRLIQEKFEKEDYRVVPLTLQIGEQIQSLYRPYTDKVFRLGGLHEPEFFQLSVGKETFGFAWACVNDARETIKDLRTRGLLIKKFGFSIGDRQFVEPFFGRTVYSRRITGEIIIQHPKLVPNAARSDFETNATRQAFFEALPRFVRSIDGWANKIQEEDLAREVLADVSDELAVINQDLPAIQRDREWLLKVNIQLSDIDRRLKPHKKRLRGIDPEGFSRLEELQSGVSDFVRLALVSQKRSRQRLEREVVKSVQREGLRLTATDRRRKETIPTDLVGLLDAYGLLELDSLRLFLVHLDEHVLKTNLSGDAYSQAIRELRDYLEENL